MYEIITESKSWKSIIKNGSSYYEVYKYIHDEAN